MIFIYTFSWNLYTYIIFTNINKQTFNNLLNYSILTKDFKIIKNLLKHKAKKKKFIRKKSLNKM